MAFEAFLEGGDLRPRRRRRLTYLVSLTVHAALLAAGIAYSFWHVEEITPPTVRVTFMAATPPPPAAAPPPPAGGASDATRPKTIHKVKTTALTAVVQPRDPPKTEPKTEPEEDDNPAQGFSVGKKGDPNSTIDGDPDGKINGKVNGIRNSTASDGPPQPTKPKTLAPQMGAKQRAGGDDPDFPALYRRTGLVYVVLAEVCVATNGSVASVTILHGANSTLDENVINTVRRSWLYHPLLANNTPVPFCYPARFEFKSN